jgi:ribulose-phosphate 3-epimerase
MQTIPSVLEKNSQDLFYQINKLSPYFKRFQIDIADGLFVPNKTVQIEDIIKFFELNNFKNFITLQTLKTLSFDFHLMVKDYKTEINKLEKLKKIIKINLILIHFSSISNFKFQISNLSDIPIGLTLNPEDQVDDLISHYSLKQIPTIQIMSVVPGVQGNPFLPDTLKKIEQLRYSGYRNKIFLDGAVNEKTIPYIIKQKFKPDVICPGSYLTKAKNLEERVKFLISNS